MTEFEGVAPVLAQALSKRGYTTLTPVQNAVLAPELRDADTLVSAQTGSGKTVAFGMAMAPDLLGDKDRFGHAAVPLALVVAPTRELAMQVKRELQWLYEMTGAVIASCVGGMDMRDERRVLQRGAHIVVGTPGRLRDHIDRGSFNPSGLRVAVLDEADEMLDLGFREELEAILEAAPEDRRTMLFSATVPRSIESLAKRYQRDAVRVNVASEQKQHLDIDYRALTVASMDQENAIVNVLRYFDAKNALVFCATRAAVNHMTSRFNNRGFSVVALSGELSQNERTHALQAMRDGRARVCVATDVAARGIDLPNLELVVHADIPKTRETLLHRSGRTGRAGRKGVCVLIVPPNARKRTERLLGNASISATWERPPTADDIIARDHERLLSDPSLTEPLSESEQGFAQQLLARHSAEQIAAAFIRQRFAEQAAPEDLREASAYEPPNRKVGKQSGKQPSKHQGKQRESFQDGVWFELSVGREQSAEPRWLLPLLCRVGNLTKNDVGPIQIDTKVTHVELAAPCVDKFLQAVGPSAKLEGSITVKRVASPPTLSRTPSQAPDRGAARTPASDPPAGDLPAKKPRKPAHRKSDATAAPATPAANPAPPKHPDEVPERQRPWGKTFQKPRAKPAQGNGPKPAKSDAKTPGSAPLKRKPKKKKNRPKP